MVRRRTLSPSLSLSVWSYNLLCVSPSLVIGLALSSWLLLPVKLLPGLRLFPPPLLSLILLRSISHPASAFDFFSSLVWLFALASELIGNWLVKKMKHSASKELLPPCFCPPVHTLALGLFTFLQHLTPLFCTSSTTTNGSHCCRATWDYWNFLLRGTNIASSVCPWLWSPPPCPTIYPVQTSALAQTRL